MAADFANEAAALAAGYKKTQLDRGAGRSPRYTTFLEKPIVGEPSAAGGLFNASGDSDVQATADANALAALNQQRKLRYGAGSASSGRGGRGGNLTDDVN